MGRLRVIKLATRKANKKKVGPPQEHPSQDQTTVEEPPADEQSILPHDEHEPHTEDHVPGDGHTDAEKITYAEKIQAKEQVVDGGDNSIEHTSEQQVSNSAVENLHKQIDNDHQGSNSSDVLAKIHALNNPDENRERIGKEIHSPEAITKKIIMCERGPNLLLKNGEKPEANHEQEIFDDEPEEDEKTEANKLEVLDEENEADEKENGEKEEKVEEEKEESDRELGEPEASIELGKNEAPLGGRMRSADETEAYLQKKNEKLQRRVQRLKIKVSNRDEALKEMEVEKVSLQKEVEKLKKQLKRPREMVKASGKKSKIECPNQSGLEKEYLSLYSAFCKVRTQQSDFNLLLRYPSLVEDLPEDTIYSAGHIGILRNDVRNIKSRVFNTFVRKALDYIFDRERAQFFSKKGKKTGLKSMKFPKPVWDDTVELLSLLGEKKRMTREAESQSDMTLEIYKDAANAAMINWLSALRDKYKTK